MLLYFTLKSHTSPPLRYTPVIGYKGTNKWAQYKTKMELFCFYCRTEVPSSYAQRYELVSTIQNKNRFSSKFSLKNCGWVQQIAVFRDVSWRNVPNYLLDSFLVCNFVVTYTPKIHIATMKIVNNTQASVSWKDFLDMGARLLHSPTEWWY